MCVQDGPAAAVSAALEAAAVVAKGWVGAARNPEELAAFCKACEVAEAGIDAATKAAILRSMPLVARDAAPLEAFAAATAANAAFTTDDVIASMQCAAASQLGAAGAAGAEAFGTAGASAAGSSQYAVTPAAAAAAGSSSFAVTPAAAAAAARSSPGVAGRVGNVVRDQLSELGTGAAGATAEVRLSDHEVHMCWQHLQEQRLCEWDWDPAISTKDCSAP
jgi:hypothetical protein